MSNTKRIIIVAILLGLVGVVWGLRGHTQQVAPAVIVTTDVPDAAVKKTLPLLVDLGADKCMSCKMMVPVLDELEREYAGELTVQFIDVWKEPDAAKPYGIRVIPTQIFFDEQGVEQFRHEGFISKEEILNKWKELGLHLYGSSSS